MSKWRPENWEETSFNLGFRTTYKSTSNELIAFSEGIEAGADAMLNYLRTSRVTIPDDPKPEPKETKPQMMICPKAKTWNELTFEYLKRKMAGYVWP